VRAPLASLLVARLAWLGGGLTLLRAALLFVLEQAHHGDPALARLRLGHAWGSTALVGLGIGALAALAGAVLDRGRARTTLRVVVAFGLAALAYAFLAGRLDADLSRRVGADTSRGLLVLAVLAVGASTIALLALVGELATVIARRPVLALAPLLPVAAGALILRGGGLPTEMVVRDVLHELVLAPWKALEAREDAAPAPGVVSPASTYRKEGAGRPSLVLAPPARVELVLPADRAAYHLEAGVGIDHGGDEEGDGSLADHTVRFRVWIDGQEAFETRVPVATERWTPVGGNAGLVVGGGARVELETTLLDASGEPVRTPDPLRAGFGGLTLTERHPVARAAASPREPSVVLILLDTLRADRTSVYGCERDTTPNLARLARRGVVFDEAFSTSSWTWPSTASILTGRAPEEHGVQDAASSFLSERLDTLAEALQREGVTTGAWSGSPLIVPDKNFDQGFEFFDSSEAGVMRRSDLFLSGALEWLETVGDRRFFLYLHLMEPHAPPVPLPEGRRLFAADVPPDFDPRRVLDATWALRTDGFARDGTPTTEKVLSLEEQRWVRDLYDACAWSADHWVGQVLERLDALGLSDTTIVAVTSDHGEELFEHGLLGHAHALWRELVHVPLIVAGPGVPVGERRPAPISNAALGPTLARLARASIAGLEGEDLDLFGPDPVTVGFSTRQGYWNGRSNLTVLGLREGTTVLHWASQGAPWGASEAPTGGEVRLFDAATDPGEHTDVSALHRDEIRARLGELARRLALSEERRRALGGFADEGTMGMLRDLGYAQ
jgi:arylsulfatase A-like enzyme